MKLAFYYHIPVALKNEQLYLPGYIGVFVDELARNAETLYLVMHQAQGLHIEEADFKLVSKNIVLINLGPKTPNWHRSVFPGKILKSKMKEIEECDAFLVRSPSPLAAFFHRYIKHPKLFFLIVGDYAEGAKQIGKKGIKNLLLNTYFNHVDKGFRKQIKRTDVLVNSPELLNKYKASAKSIELVRTTTLQDSDYFEKSDIATHKPVKLLYTGRIEVAKGLTELVYAAKQLIDKDINVELHIVGWEDNKQNLFTNKLKTLAEELKIADHLKFHGKKKIGDELNAFYRESDLYILPSYHEGFPRTIWEAMANSLPVIATTVGAIPYYLESGKNCILVEPKNVEQLTEAIEKCLASKEFRLSLVQNGYVLAQESSLSFQTKKIIDCIKKTK